MYSRCPQCQSVHALNAEQLAAAGGLVRCGNCSFGYSALSHLFDYWPDSSSSPAPVNSTELPPVLGEVLQSDPGAVLAAREQSPASPADPNRKWWLVLLVILALMAVANLAWTFKEPILGNPAIRTWLVDKGLLNSGLLEELAPGPFRDLTLLHLVSRDLHQHPARAGMLALSVIFVNRATQAQPYPGIRVKLMNSANELLATRRFSADEYLPNNADLQAGMPPNVHIPILLEFVDPGTGATGYELEFE